MKLWTKQGLQKKMANFKLVLLLALLIFLANFECKLRFRKTKGKSRGKNKNRNFGSRTHKAEGRQLVDQINRYRKSRGKPTIPYSPTMARVAHTHALDQISGCLGGPRVLRPGQCQLHNWYTQHRCTFSSSNPGCMTRKPEQLFGTKVAGYEISGHTDGPVNYLNGWIRSKWHHPVMINSGKWSGTTWSGIGCAIVSSRGKYFANCWFSLATPTATSTSFGGNQKPTATFASFGRNQPKNSFGSLGRLKPKTGGFSLASLKPKTASGKSFSSSRPFLSSISYKPSRSSDFFASRSKPSMSRGSNTLFSSYRPSKSLKKTFGGSSFPRTASTSKYNFRAFNSDKPSSNVFTSTYKPAQTASRTLNLRGFA